MSAEQLEALDTVDHVEVVHARLERSIADNDLALPLLPDVAIRLMRIGTREATNAHDLADIIHADAALTECVLRIAGSAAKRPVTPIASLQHAVAWLGFDEVANIAFTLALQGTLLDVRSDQPRARRLWRHALASALWSRHLAQLLAEETGLSYLCGLLHDIGRVVTLRAVHDVAHRGARPSGAPIGDAGIGDAGLGARLGDADCGRLIETFHRRIGARVVTVWQLPAPVPAVTMHWERPESLGAARLQGNLVNVAHRLADYTLLEPTPLARDLLVTDPAYRDLGFKSGDGDALFDSVADINAELDRYLAR